MKDDDEKPDAAELRERAERAIARGGAPRPASGDDPVAVLHELQVHQIELEMQNDALRQSQVETEAARERLAALNEGLEGLVLARTAELAAARDKAEAASRAKTEFLARMSHELRTPLNGIIGMTELARRRATDPRQVEQLDKALGAGRHLLGLIEALIDLSDGEAGRMALDPTPFSPARAVSEVIAEMAGPAEVAGMALSVDIDPSLPATLVGDAARIQQVLTIFIGNAIKFARRGRIAVRVRVLGKPAPDCRLRLEVEDDGAAIPKAQRERLFEAFTQADESSTRRHGGAGVGLALCRHLVRRMGGEAGVTGEEGEGNTFWAELRLPGADGN